MPVGLFLNIVGADKFYSIKSWCSILFFCHFIFWCSSRNSMSECNLVNPFMSLFLGEGGAHRNWTIIRVTPRSKMNSWELHFKGFSCPWSVTAQDFSEQGSLLRPLPRLVCLTLGFYLQACPPPKPDSGLDTPGLLLLQVVSPDNGNTRTASEGLATHAARQPPKDYST
jgi:hypothetical protein